MKESKWHSVTRNPPNFNEYILIKTVTSLVRVAKRVRYPDGYEEYMYSSQSFKNVMWWQPLPK